MTSKRSPPPTTPTPADAQCKAYGEAFRAARKGAGRTLLATAKALSCSVNKVRWHEAGDTMLRLDELHDAAEFFGCQVADLVTPLQKA